MVKYFPAKIDPEKNKYCRREKGMDLIYNIKDKPKFGQTVLFALQQLLAIMAATIDRKSVV